MARPEEAMGIQSEYWCKMTKTINGPRICCVCQYLLDFPAHVMSCTSYLSIHIEHYIVTVCVHDITLMLYHASLVPRLSPRKRF